MHFPPALNRRLWAAATLALLAACSSMPRASEPAAGWADTIDRLPPTQVLLLGEQHDAPEHQQLHARIVGRLAEQGRLAALVMEMAPTGGHTDALAATASETEVKAALRWEDAAWPWPAYGPAVMAAVRAGVPVRGGNLPLAQLRGRMADLTLEARLSPEALDRQQTLIREGHCGLLPEPQIAPMARMQIARDLSMATALAEALPQARPGQVVVLVAGSVHADRQLGVPQHLPAGVRSTSLRLAAGGQGLPGERFDLRLPTPAAPVTDHCAALAGQLKR